MGVHEFKPDFAHSRLCLLCGREVNDYEYHFAPVATCDHRRQSVNAQGATCDICGLHAPGKGWVDTETADFQALTISDHKEREQYGHVFTYRSDYNQCSVCNGTHGRDDHAEITRLRAENRRLIVAMRAAGVVR